MNGALNYIKHQEKKIKEIEAKRDELKKMYNSSNFEISKLEQTPNCRFKISSFDGGVVEILITTNGFHGFPLSRILKVVVEQGLEVIRCGSTIVNHKSIHTIQIEVRLLLSLIYLLANLKTKAPIFIMFFTFLIANFSKIEYKIFKNI